jgi:hypothetical protein
MIKSFLLSIQQKNISNRHVGLCTNFKEFCYEHNVSYEETSRELKKFQDLMRRFPKYTGCHIYPLVASADYDEHSREGIDFYDPESQHGKIRLEFIEWALEEIAQNRVSYMKD